MKNLYSPSKPVLIALVITFSLTSWAQPNTNTTWTAHDVNGSFFSYYKFFYDTVFVSSDNITYSPDSYYTYDGTIVRIADLFGSQCPSTDTGNYFPNTINDTMIFVYTGDACLARQLFFANFYFVRFTGTTANKESSMESVIVSNPFDATITIGNIDSPYTFTLFDSSGRLLKEESRSSETMIDASEIPAGIYYFILKTSEGRRSGKLIKN